MLFESPQGVCELHYPHRASRGASTTLRAWDAADEHLLRALEAWREERNLSRGELKGEAWVVGDAFGALTLPLLLAYPKLYVRVSLELVASEHWIRDNLARTLTHHPHLDPLSQQALEGRVSFSSHVELSELIKGGEARPPLIALLKVPQHLSLWARQLEQLSEALSRHPHEVWSHPSQRPLVMAGGMCKHVHTSTIKAMEERLGASPTSLAWRKSRLILPTLEAPPVQEGAQASQKPSQASPKMSSPSERMYRLSAQDLSREALSPHLARLELINTPGVFSEGGLDQGARALLPHLSGAFEQAVEARERAELLITESNPLRIADLGCGDGVLSFVFAALALERGVRIELSLFDVAASALESAQLTWARWREGLSERERDLISLRCFGGDVLAPWRALPNNERNLFDVILNNPPFHQKGARLSSVSAQMFREAREALAPWGALWVVGNRQLGYHASLKRLFERCSVPSEHPKFVVVCAERPCASS